MLDSTSPLDSLWFALPRTLMIPTVWRKVSTSLFPKKVALSTTRSFVTWPVNWRKSLNLEIKLEEVKDVISKALIALEK